MSLTVIPVPDSNGWTIARDGVAIPHAGFFGSAAAAANAIEKDPLGVFGIEANSPSSKMIVLDAATSHAARLEQLSIDAQRDNELPAAERFWARAKEIREAVRRESK